MLGPDAAAPASAAKARPTANETRLDAVERVSLRMGLLLWVFGDGLESIAGRGIVPGDARELVDAPTIDGAGDERDEVHGLGHEMRLGRDAGLLDQQVQAGQRGGGAVGVHGGDAARMPGVPGFQEREGLGPADLADDDAIRPEAHRDARQTREIRDVAGVELDGVAGRAAKLARVLENDEASG